MSYINTLNILPEELVKEIQKYVDGEYVYIPKLAMNRKTWGSTTDTKQVMAERNSHIFEDYHKGESVKELADKYYLSEKSIYRILGNQNKKCG